MSVSTSLLSFTDCIDYFDQALRFSEGCRIPVPDRKYGVNLRMRLNYCRSLDRENNATLYAPGHMMHGRSQYDKITCTIEEEGDKTFVYLKRNDLVRLEVEGLGHEVEQMVPLAEPEPQRQLPAPQAMDELELTEPELVEVPKAEPEIIPPKVMRRF